jgi:kynurenine formamidase
VTALSERGGIVGRGILLDFVRYAEKKGTKADPLSNYAISLTQIKEMIAEEKLEIRQGDILLVRSGLSKWIHASTQETAGPWEGGKMIGVDPTDELLEWIWDSNFGAVGGDGIAFECVPDSAGKCKSELRVLFE